MDSDCGNDSERTGGLGRLLRSGRNRVCFFLPVRVTFGLRPCRIRSDEGTRRHERHRECSWCGNPLSAETVPGLCPKCLALKTSEDRTAKDREILQAHRSLWDEGSETVQITALTPEPAVSPTVRYFGDYELIEEIARGGMGVVFKARQTSP